MRFRKIFLLVIPVLLFLSSCDYKKDNPPSARYLSQGFTTRLQSLPVNTEFEVAVSLPGGATNAVYDSLYKVPMTWAQGWHADSLLTKVVFILALLLVIPCIYLMYRSSENRKDPNGKSFLAWLVPIFALLILAASVVDWFHTYEREIKKTDYVHYMQTDGSLENFWPTPAQKY